MVEPINATKAKDLRMPLGTGTNYTKSNAVTEKRKAISNIGGN